MALKSQKESIEGVLGSLVVKGKLRVVRGTTRELSHPGTAGSNSFFFPLILIQGYFFPLRRGRAEEGERERERKRLRTEDAKLLALKMEIRDTSQGLQEEPSKRQRRQGKGFTPEVSKRNRVWFGDFSPPDCNKSSWHFSATKFEVPGWLQQQWKTNSGEGGN